MTDKLFIDRLRTLLKTDDGLIDDHGELNLALVRDRVDTADEGLIRLLMSDPDVKAKFFLAIDDVQIFRQHDFKFFLDANQLDNSFTEFENRIGLTDTHRFLKENENVVLSFPYKDCVLEGGQTKEEGKDQYFEKDPDSNDYVRKESVRKEIFFNEILAKDEIDRLYEPKAFTNIQRYDKTGSRKIKSFTRNDEGRITDNLIIKGNNLLALHSIKRQFAGTIKLIYIDPPFAKDVDSFYNDNFKRSTWLTFMKNRLEVAWELLSDDGYLFIHIDDKHQPYLRVLCDEILKESNLVNVIVLKSGRDEGVKMAHKEKKLVKFKEYINFYAKGEVKLIPQYKEKFTWDKRYKFWLERNNSSKPADWKVIPLSQRIKEIGLSIADDEEILEWMMTESANIIRTANNDSEIVRQTKNKEGIWEFQSPKGLPVFAYKGEKILFASNKIKDVNGEEKLGEYVGDIWDDISYNNLHNEGGVDLPNGKKPEALIERIINLCIPAGETATILDYHVGCGTTAAVAHKLGHQYIGIEQLDYGNNDSVKRLKNVIAGENVGLSVEWKGGGSFVYLELSKWNAEAKEKILACKSLSAIVALLTDFTDKYFLNHDVKFKEFREKVINEDAFKKLALDRQKDIVSRMLDLNQLYVNFSEIEDKQYTISKPDIDLIKDFYGE